MSYPITWPGGIPVTDRFYSLQGPELAELARYGFNAGIQGYGSNQATPLSMNTPSDYLAAWEKCPPLVSIICAQAEMDYNGRVAFYRPNKEEEIKPNGNNSEAKSMAELFAQPNPLQTWPEFRAQQFIYKKLFGICPILTVKPVGFTMPKMMWNIPPHICKITTSGKLYYQSEVGKIITKIEVEVNGKREELKVDDVIFLRDQTVSLSSEWLPDSRLKTLVYPISNIVAAYEAANVLITKRGALGIFSNAGRDTMGTIPVTANEKQDLQSSLAGYGISHATSQYIVTTAALQWQQIGVNAKELMLIEFNKQSTEAICDRYGHQFELLANEKGSTFSNQKEAKAWVYQNTIIPGNDADFQVYNNYFRKVGAKVEAWNAFDHIAELQKSQLDAAMERKAINDACLIEWEAGKLTMNMWAVMLGDKELDGEQFSLFKPQYDEWLRKAGLLPPMVDPNKKNEDESATA